MLARKQQCVLRCVIYLSIFTDQIPTFPVFLTSPCSDILFSIIRKQIPPCYYSNPLSWITAWGVQIVPDLRTNRINKQNSFISPRTWVLHAFDSNIPILVKHTNSWLNLFPHTAIMWQKFNRA